MKKLYELIEDAERKLQICTEGERPAIYFDLSTLYGFVNTDKSTAYEEKVFAASIDTESELYISTQIAFGNSKLNMYEFEATAKIVEETLAKAEALNLTHQMHDALLLKAMLLLEQGKAIESKVVFEQCLAMHRLFNNAYSKTMCLCLFARVYDDISKVEAGKLLFKALDEIRQSDKKWVEGYVLYTLAEWAKDNGDSENTLQYLTEALRIFEEHKALAWLGLTLSTLADYYMLIANYELALETNLKALKLLQAEANLREYVIGLSSTVKPLLALKRLQEAREYTQLGIDLSTKHHFNKQLAFFYSMQASVEMAESEFLKAIGSLKLSVESYGAEIPLSNLVSIKQKMAKCYEELSDYAKAYIAMVEYDEIKTKLSDAERTKETVALNKKYETEKRESELRELKIKQQQTELEQRESELKAIKAQMNPHFIFNALNSIQEMFFIGDKRLANEHLGKFSQLTREILKASGKQFISLSEEIEMLKKYLELEGLRFESAYSFSVTVNDEDIADDVMLPPMLIQPYVENAIRHGLLHKKGAKIIAVHFEFEEEKKQLACTVTDNGVGRKASAEINAGRKQLHESFSTSANAKRLELLNQNRQDKIGVQYEDLNEGTRVSILIPVSYD